MRIWKFSIHFRAPLNLFHPFLRQKGGGLISLPMRLHTLRQDSPFSMGRQLVRPDGGSGGGLTAIAERSHTAAVLMQGGDFVAWEASSGPETMQSIDSTWERVVVEDPAGAGHARRFGRIRVSTP